MLIGGPPGPAPQVLSALRARVRALLELDEDTSIIVRQLDCADADCPPIETVIAVLAPGQEIAQWKLHCPAQDIDESALVALLARAPQS
ncbi:MAG: hypothetical protein ACT4PP_14270 [Sporichthyaceae bacterium]